MVYYLGQLMMAWICYIRPNYLTVHLGVSNLLGKHSVKCISNELRVYFKKRSAKDLFDDV